MRKPFSRRSEPCLLLDAIEGANPVERLLGHWRFRRFPYLEELPAAVRPARHFRDRRSTGPSRIKQRLEPSIAIGLEKAAECRHVASRMLAAAIRAEEVGRGRWRRSAERPVIAHIDPEPTGLGLAIAGRQHRNRRVVAVDLLGREDMAAD